MKKITALLLSLTLALTMAACGADDFAAVSFVTTPSGSASSAPAPEGSAPDVSGPDASQPEAAQPDASAPEDQDSAPGLPVEGEYYYDLKNVVLYLELYDQLPDNYITKSEARDLGWSGGSVERYLDGAAIGGDRFGNREGILPDGDYTECDLNTDGQDSRGAERLVFSDDGRYYCTVDHYETFTEYVVTEDWAVVER